MNIFLDIHSRTPVYEQIKEQIVLEINRENLKKDEQLPSLRQLSASLGININTVKRALSELEAQGFIYTIAGKGIFVSGNVQSSNIYLEQSLNTLKKAFLNAKAMGATQQQITKLLDDIFKGAEEND